MGWGRGAKNVDNRFLFYHKNKLATVQQNDGVALISICLYLQTVVCPS